MKLLNLSHHWQKIRPHLHNRQVRSILNESLEIWCKEYLDGRSYNPTRGPWWYSQVDYWHVVGPPKRDSPDWYRMIAGCHWLAPWACELGKRAFPAYEWCVAKSERHSLAMGISETGPQLLFDILLYRDYTCKYITRFLGRYVRITPEQAIKYYLQ